MGYEEQLKLEKSSYSINSPCVVSDAEQVARVLFYPNHYKNKKVTPAAFEQIFDSRGMSVLRIEIDFDNCLKKTAEIVEKKSEKKLAGYTTASVDSIRNIHVGVFRLFYVVDTAKEDRVGHADIFTTRKNINIPEELVNNVIRSKIFRVFSTTMILHCES